MAAEKKFHTTVEDADLTVKPGAAPAAPATPAAPPTLEEPKTEEAAPVSDTIPSRRLGAEQEAGRRALERKHSNKAVAAEKSRGKK